MSTEVAIELTTEQKIQILEKTKELLGPNGEGWTKSCWFGVKKSPDEINEWLEVQGYEFRLDELEPAAINDLIQETDYEAVRRGIAINDADQANVWCLLGAIEESAYRLGIVQERDASERFANPISLQKLVDSKEEWHGWSVIDVNDAPNTTFETVRDLIDERLAQLRAE